MTCTIASPEPPAEISASEALAFTNFSDVAGATLSDEAPDAAEEFAFAGLFALCEHAEKPSSKTMKIIENWFRANIGVIGYASQVKQQAVAHWLLGLLRVPAWCDARGAGSTGPKGQPEG